MARVRRILHPSDFSKASGAAFAKAVELAKANRPSDVLLRHFADSGDQRWQRFGENSRSGGV